MFGAYGRIGVAILTVVALAGCATTGPVAEIKSTSMTQPLAAAPAQLQVPTAPTLSASTGGMDFSQAVAALASTPGSGVTSVGPRPSSALALVQPSRPAAAPAAKPKPQPVAARAAAAVPVPPPLAAPADPCIAAPDRPGCPGVTVFGDKVEAVRRF